MMKCLKPNSSEGGNFADAEARAVGKIMRRLVPFTMVLYVLNYLDRVNVAFAKLSMSKDLGFSEPVYGFGASIFFAGYFLFELPGNLIMKRVGARFWIARIMLSWGLVSTGMMFVNTPRSFYILRFLLGVAEAGFFPALMLFLADWLPPRYRARVTAWFLTAIAWAGIVGSPLSGLLLDMHGFGLAGWRWLFLLEGIPSIFLGFVVLAILPNNPREAGWLDDGERDALLGAVRAEHAGQHPGADLLKAGLTTPVVWMLAIVYGLIMFGFYAVSFYGPSVIKQVSSGSNLNVGWLSALPFAAAMVGMVLLGKVADATGKGLITAALSLMIGAAGMAFCALCSSTMGTVLALAVAATGIYGALAPFWTVPPAILRGSAVAAAIAIINSIGNLGGGMIGPNIIAHLRVRHSSYSSGLLASAAVLVVAAIVASVLAMWLAPVKQIETGEKIL